MFNNKKAWKELACPALMALSPDVHQLILRVFKEGRGINQSPDLSVPWPASDLRAKFEEIPSEELARASHIVWATGHWHPGTNNLFRPLMRQGTYWKFSAWADEILRDRCGLSRNHSVKNCFSFEIHEGFIRVCIGFDKSFQWYNVALATPGNLNNLKELVPSQLNLSQKCIKDTWKLINQTIKKMKNFVPARMVKPDHSDEPCAHMDSCLITDPIAKFFDLKEFTDE